LAVTPGKKLVRISGGRKTGKKITTAGASGVPRETEVIEPLVPAIYNDQSTLTVEIAAGKRNEHNFDLKP
jgi:hypothetical protein